MKHLFLALLLSCSLSGFCNERFYTEKEEKENLVIKLITDLSSNIEKIEKKQEELITVLHSIRHILEPYTVHEWKEVHGAMDK